MNYKAHIPAGVALAAGVTYAFGLPLVVPFIIGGAIGGALPDIDVKEGAAIEKLGSKSADAVKKVTGRSNPLGAILGFFGKALDVVVLRPLGKLWRFTAERVLTPLYYAVLKATRADERLGWQKKPQPYDHRGGLTHSFFFCFLTSILFLPLSFLLTGGLWLWGGIEVGIVSHLLADSFCRSGVKFFWPWAPAIGFPDKNGANKGKDIRLLPFPLQMSTGAVANKGEINQAPKEERAVKRKLYYLEKGWQKFFQLSAIILLILTVAGFGVGSGKITLDGNSSVVTAGGALTVEKEQPGSATSSGKIDVSLLPDSSATAAKSAEGRVTVAERVGPASLTAGDADLASLPKGIAKLPDETLWVVGVGEVSKENLNDPKWSFTDNEKTRLLELAGAQRKITAPNNLAETLSEKAAAAGEEAKSTGNVVTDLLSSLLGSANEKSGGFYGLTPYTPPSPSNGS